MCVFSLSVLSPNARRRTLLFSLFLSLSAGAIARIVLEKRKEREREMENFLSKRRSLSFGKKKNLERSHFDKDRERERPFR